MNRKFAREDHGGGLEKDKIHTARIWTISHWNIGDSYLILKTIILHENLFFTQYKQTWRVKKLRTHQLSVINEQKGLKNIKYSK